MQLASTVQIQAPLGMLHLGCSALSSVVILSFPLTWLGTDFRVFHSFEKVTERVQEVKSKPLCASLMGSLSWDFEKFWTNLSICSQEPMEKSCHLQVVVDLLFPLTGSAHQLAAITLLICLWHTRSVILQWLCCGSRPAALQCTFYLATAPITNFHGCLVSFSYSG